MSTPPRPDRVVAPYGAWASPIPIERLVAGVVGLDEVHLDGNDVYWLESRPSEGGREAVVRLAPDGSTADATPGEVNVRNRVHEYGGGSYAVDGGEVFFSNWADGRWYAIRPGEEARPLTPEGPLRYADAVVDRRRGRLIAIREDHSGGGEAVNAIVSVPLDGSANVEVLVDGADFYSSPRLAPDGGRLAWLSWNHPNMPWDGSELWLSELDAAGRPAHPARIAGSASEWTSQPRWSPDGVLHFVDERSGWMQLYRRVGESDELLTPIEAEFAGPDWVFGQSSYAFAGGARIVAAGRSGGRARLWSIAPGATPVPCEMPFTEIGSVEAAGRRALFTASGPTQVELIVALDLDSGTFHVIRQSREADIDPADISVAEPIDFETTDGTIAHGLFYAPRNSRFVAPAGELPPLIVSSHGGPTGQASTGLSTRIQLFTSRGIAFLDVDYRGSTGYGRSYRHALNGQWGIADVDDCVHGALALADRGLVDRERIAIRGGSASGYTTLCAITFRDTFGAGVSYYGIGDLEALETDTHKFESRYTHGLVAPYPERRDLYVERSPVHFVDRIRCPVLILQGLDDRVVPPDQARDMMAAMAANHVTRVAIYFEGEDHGFRKAESIIRSCEAEALVLRPGLRLHAGRSDRAGGAGTVGAAAGRSRAAARGQWSSDPPICSSPRPLSHLGSASSRLEATPFDGFVNLGPDRGC